MICIFCRADTDLTREHIFPAFMGGDIELPNATCSACQYQFSRWEAEIKEQIITLLNLLRIGNRRGEVPTADVEIKVRGVDVDGLTGFREGTGEIKPLSRVVEQVDESGKRRRRAILLTDKEATRFIEKAKARGEHTEEIPMPDEVVLDSSYRLDLSFAGTPAARRVVAKIALTSLAYKFGRDFALGQAFEQLREARDLTLNRPLPVRLFANQSFFESCRRTPHQHSIVCYLSAGRKKGWLAVTLFGGITFLVDVPNYDGNESRSFMLFYDSLQREQYHPIVSGNEIELIDKILDQGTVYEQPRLIDAQWGPLFRKYCDEAGIPIERVGKTGSKQ